MSGEAATYRERVAELNQAMLDCPGGCTDDGPCRYHKVQVGQLQQQMLAASVDNSGRYTEALEQLAGGFVSWPVKALVVAFLVMSWISVVRIGCDFIVWALLRQGPGGVSL